MSVCLAFNRQLSVYYWSDAPNNRLSRDQFQMSVLTFVMFLGEKEVEFEEYSESLYTALRNIYPILAGFQKQASVLASEVKSLMPKPKGAIPLSSCLQERNGSVSNFNLSNKWSLNLTGPLHLDSTRLGLGTRLGCLL